MITCTHRKGQHPAGTLVMTKKCFRDGESMHHNSRVEAEILRPASYPAAIYDAHGKPLRLLPVGYIVRMPCGEAMYLHEDEFVVLQVGVLRRRKPCKTRYSSSSSSSKS